MADANFRRREFAAAALLAMSPLFSGRANAKLKVVNGTTSSTSTSSGSTTTTSTSTTTTTTSTTSTTLTGDTCPYGPPILDSYGRANFAGRLWWPQDDTTKVYAIEEGTSVTPYRHRFEVRSGDTWSGDAGTGKNRAEYCCIEKETFGVAVWFSYALRLHSGSPVSNWNVLGQFHHTPDPGESHSPPFSFNFIPGEQLRIVKRTDPNPLTTTDVPPTIMYEQVLARDTWYRFVGRIVFGWNNDGACEIWMNGVKVVNLPVTNIGFNDAVGPFWKFGIYRGSSPETLVAEYANFEIGSGSLLDRVANPLPIT